MHPLSVHQPHWLSGVQRGRGQYLIATEHRTPDVNEPNRAGRHPYRNLGEALGSDGDGDVDAAHGMWEDEDA